MKKRLVARVFDVKMTGDPLDYQRVMGEIFSATQLMQEGSLSWADVAHKDECACVTDSAPFSACTCPAVELAIYELTQT